MGKKAKDRQLRKAGSSVVPSKSFTEQLQSIDKVSPTNKNGKRMREEEPEEFVEGKVAWKINKERKLQIKEVEETMDENEWPSLNASETEDIKAREVHIKDMETTVFFSDMSDHSDCDSLDGDNMEISEEDKLLLETGEAISDSAALSEEFRKSVNMQQQNIQSLHDSESMADCSVTPELQQFCRKIGATLATHRHGKLPKFIHYIPTFSNWEEYLDLTDPDSWSAKAMYDVTKIFASSNTKEEIVQQYFNAILLPRVRDEITSRQKLNPHLYQALYKSLYRPSAFNKGFLFPLCNAGDCTLREAVIIGSVLSKRSIPLLHAGAAMLKISDMPYTGANSIFLIKLIKKKYALPLLVIDSIIGHFLRYNGRWAHAHKQELPVLWFQSLLAFIQIYKNYIEDEGKEALRDLLRGHYHHKITPEIQRELDNSVNKRKTLSK